MTQDNFIRPGRAAPCYKCSRCGADVSVSVALDPAALRPGGTPTVTAVVRCEGRCPPHTASWPAGTAPPPLPVKGGLDFNPVPR